VGWISDPELVHRLLEAKHVPVIFISGADPKKYEQRALAEGAAKFFRKPVEGDQLLATVGEVLLQVEAAP
jgi:FixJ family two-component response regulator